MKKFSARIPCARDRKNSANRRPSQRGGGSIPASLRICQAVPGATVMPSGAVRQPRPAAAGDVAMPPHERVGGDDQPHRGRLLIVSESHLRRVLAGYPRHYQHRPAASCPRPARAAQAHTRPPEINLAEHLIRRRQTLGGLTHEYQIAA